MRINPYSFRCMEIQVQNTPNIDQLANDGMVYQNCYTPSPACAQAEAV